ncbi:hypothetical protein RDWZM_003678, partial [Blomia tropicalis]
ICLSNLSKVSKNVGYMVDTNRCRTIDNRRITGTGRRQFARLTNKVAQTTLANGNRIMASLIIIGIIYIINDRRLGGAQ